MQKGNKSGSRHVQTPRYQPARKTPKDSGERSSALLLAVLCVVLPPVGLLFLWRSNRVPVTARLIFSLAATASMTFLFTLLIRPDAVDQSIRPMPATPVSAGYGVISGEQLPLPEATSPAAPAQPGVVPASPDAGVPAPETTDPASEGALTMESIVYAVTNNASSYHRYEICDTQTNNRALTLQDALNEGLTPCEKCIGPAG